VACVKDPIQMDYRMVSGDGDNTRNPVTQGSVGRVH